MKVKFLLNKYVQYPNSQGQRKSSMRL